MRSFWSVAAILVIAAPAFAEQRPLDVMHPVVIDRGSVPMVVNSHVIYLNPCLPNGCKLTQGDTDSRTDHSDIIGSGQAVLTPYPGGTTSWNNVVSCMKTVFKDFNVTITDQDPGTADHFEVMIAGSPADVGLPSQVGGIADFGCNAPGQCIPYIPNALVFDFAKVWGGNVNEICATAAQEIAHAWTLDHVVDPSDPMTYNNYSGMRLFHDNEQCGSDCVNGQGPFGQTCTGQNHICMSTGQQTQNEIQIIKALFGPAGAQAPTLTLKNPKNGSAQPTGFTIDVDCTSNDGIQEVDLTVDGISRGSLTAAPFTFTAPAGLKDGTHHVSVMCATKLQATATADADIITGAACTTDTDCPANYLCYDKTCIAGPAAMGGIGATCTANSDCVSGSCASDGQMMLCVIPCDTSAAHCPSGFGCIAAGASGVCWAGADSGGGGGCCDSRGSGAPAGSILLGLGFAATLVTRKKRR